MKSRWWPILSNGTLLESAQSEAARQGFTVVVDNGCDDWDYRRPVIISRPGSRIAQEVGTSLSDLGRRVTVRVEDGGVGGRNQQFTLALHGEDGGKRDGAERGNGRHQRKPSAAGAVVDGTTLERARSTGLDVSSHLEGFNAFPFFDALGDAVITGPTGNNLRDLRILFAY